MIENPYETLGISREASTAEVKKAYFALVKQYSPETHAERFKEIREAYDRLKDRTLRQETEVFLYSDPYGAFKTPGEAQPFKPRMRIDKVMMALLRGHSDLDRVDFREDFTEIA